MQQALLQEIRTRETPKDAPIGGVVRRFSGLCDGRNCWLAITTTSQKTQRDVCDACAKSFASQKALKKHRDRSSSIWQLFMLSVRSTLLQKRQLKEISSENMAMRSTRLRLATLTPFVRRAFTTEAIWENT